MTDVARLAVMVDANVGSAVTKLKGVETQFWRTDAAAREMDRGVGRTGRNAAKSTAVLNTATKGMALGAAAGLALSGRAAVSWESSFAGVRKTVDASEAQFKELETGIRNMATEIPVSAGALAEIAESAGQLGIKRGAILDFTRVVADMGVATNLVGEEGASMMAKFANITGMSQGNFDRLGSTIVDLGNNGASTEADIAAMGLRIAAAGKQVGMSEAETLGYANALASVGMEAEAGGSAMSRVFKRISTATRKGGDDLKLLASTSGMSAQQFKKAFETDASGATQKFIEGLGRMQDSGGDVLGTLDALRMNDIRVSDSLMRLSGNSKILSDSLTTSENAWRSNTALAEEAARRYETTASQLQILKNHATEAGISIGTAFLPSINTFAQLGVGVLQSKAALTALTIVAGGLAGRMVALGAAWSVGKIIAFAGGIRSAAAAFALLRGAAMGGTLVSQLGSIAGAFGVAGAGASALLGPLGLIVGAAAVAGVALYAYSSNNDKTSSSSMIAAAAIRDQARAFDELHSATANRDSMKNQIRSMDLNIDQMRGQRNSMPKGIDRSALNAQIQVMIDQRNDLAAQLEAANAKVAEAEAGLEAGSAAGAANTAHTQGQKDAAAATVDTAKALGLLAPLQDRTALGARKGAAATKAAASASKQNAADQRALSAAAGQTSQAMVQMAGRYAKVPKLVQTRIKVNSVEQANKLNGLTKRLDSLKGKNFTAKVLAKADGAEDAIKLIQAALEKADGKTAKPKVKQQGAEGAKRSVDALKTSIDNLQDKTVNVTVNKRETKGKATGGRVAPDEALTRVNERGQEMARYPDGSYGLLPGGRDSILALPGGTRVHTAGETARLLRKDFIPGMASGGRKRPKKDDRAQRTLRRLDFLNDTGKLSDKNERRMLDKALKSKGKGKLSADTRQEIARRRYELTTTRKSELKDIKAQGKMVGASDSDKAKIARDMAKRHLDEAKRAKDSRAIAQAELELLQATEDLAQAQKAQTTSWLDAGVALAALTEDPADDNAAWQAIHGYWTGELNKLLTDDIDDSTQGALIVEAATALKGASDQLGQAAQTFKNSGADLEKAAKDLVRIADDTKNLQGPVLKKAIRDGINSELGGIFGSRLQTTHGRQRLYAQG